MKRILAALLFICVLAAEAGAAQSLTISSGGWNQVIGIVDLSAGPGSDLMGSYTSTMPVRLTVAGCTDSTDSWRIEVRRIDGAWDPAVRLYVTRTSSGSGSGTISGGLGETEVTGTDVPFITGTGDREDITIEMKLAGISIHVPPGLYSGSIAYTIVDTP